MRTPVKESEQSTIGVESQLGRALVNVREKVLRGEFRPGERIFEVPLAKQLGVSRTPIRIALERLAQEGLLESLGSNGGFVVREFTVRDIWDAIDTRGLLEGAAVKLAAERLTDPDELATIRRINAQIDEVSEPYVLVPGSVPSANELTRYAELNAQFHAAFFDLAKSPMLRWTAERIESIPFAGPKSVVMSRGIEFLTIAQEHHHAIIEAISNREGSRAESLAREHARLARKNLEMALAQHEQLLATRVWGATLIKTDTADFRNVTGTPDIDVR